MMKLIGMLVVPVFFSVTGLEALVVPTAWLPNAKPTGETRKNVPLPVSGTVCGLPGALSVTESVPLSAPEIVGVKVTVMVQLAPAFRLVPQVLVCE
jgi:hypothetical protein